MLQLFIDECTGDIMIIGSENGMACQVYIHVMLMFLRKAWILLFLRELWIKQLSRDF